jgi:hypothetical protein
MSETTPQPATRIRKIITRGARWMMGLLYLVCIGVLPAQAPFNATSTTPDAELEQHFHSPPASARPWVFWMWLHTDTTREAITRDLEEMHAKGIAGVILYDSGPGTAMKASTKMELRGKGYEVVPTKDFPNAHITKIPGEQLASWSPRSRELFRHGAKEAGRLGVKFCLTVGLAGTSGAIAAEYGQQKLMWSETEVVGPIDFDAVVPGPATDVPATNGTGVVCRHALQPNRHVVGTDARVQRLRRALFIYGHQPCGPRRRERFGNCRRQSLAKPHDWRRHLAGRQTADRNQPP